jgi:hypothetical protein
MEPMASDTVSNNLINPLVLRSQTYTMSNVLVLEQSCLIVGLMILFSHPYVYIYDRGIH